MLIDKIPNNMVNGGEIQNSTIHAYSYKHCIGQRTDYLVLFEMSNKIRIDFFNQTKFKPAVKIQQQLQRSATTMTNPSQM